MKDLVRPLGRCLALAIVLLPNPSPPSRRDTAQDLETLQRTECEYRGITASFGEVTRAYVLKTYEGSELLRWEAEPSPLDPYNETLVTAVFTAKKVRASAPQPYVFLAELRQNALPVFGVSWRYSALSATRVEPYNDYARDALTIFQETVKSFRAQMVLVTTPATLREGPGKEHKVIAEIEAGTVLFQQRQENQWHHVRVPETTQSGWIEADVISSLSHAR
tara:strand:- start:349 stop:1011 length:663 start_codon:yes stop_codon:yes gene_type:complete